MCESSPHKAHGWKGWRDLPLPEIAAASGPWVDLSHRITETLSRIPFFPQPRIRRIWTKPPDNANVTEVHMVVHHGTHLDAPPAFHRRRSGHGWDTARSPARARRHMAH